MIHLVEKCSEADKADTFGYAPWETPILSVPKCSILFHLSRRSAVAKADSLKLNPVEFVSKMLYPE